ncbi:helix-turn-helix domain-containing protein [Paenibacillus campinasensis]|uniref:AraC family transcriptional regulator n=2 Tax=Paenibacillus campinasensis TaxID=66347 RepID=A0A268F4C4_9BACL|nr:helix-turn-helix domain-containing protein [Paenibacillus campinasensis]MUG64474.1 helix-turn-helix domain-containing protein [Paenibacillus campinasensis]PAD80210.1 AraC family transcriptional regulator [Paenibacillus campinasensis]
MKKNWYRRMLLSYFPIFFVTMAVLIFIFIIVVSDISYKQTVKADRITTDYVVGRLSSSLKGIEMDVLKEIEKNKRYEDFLNVALTEQNSQIIIDVAGSLRELVASDSLIHSIYIYRIQDEKVLTRSGLVDSDRFADRSFIEQALIRLDTRSWSPIRSYREFGLDQEKQVVSMYKREPLPFGNDGLVVINIDVYAVEQMIRSMNSNEVSFLDVRDASGELLFSTRSADAGKDDQQGKVVNRITLDLLGWQFESGIAAGHLFLWVSLISYIWVVIGIVTVVLALIYIVFITKRNYKPIRTMMSRIESLHEREDAPSLNRDEMALIDQTLENLIRQAADFEKQQRENLLVSRRQLFYDIMLGEKLSRLDERLKKLGVHPDMEDPQLAFVVVEIRNYHDFRSTFSERDQRTLKFALTNVLQELAQMEGMYCWAEWVAEERMGMIVGVSNSHSSALHHIKGFADKGREWVEQHLRFSLLFCIGQLEVDWQHMKRSYKAAEDVLQHKLSLGKEAIMISEDLPEASDRRWYEYVLISSELVKEFRHLDGEWRTCMERLFEQMKKDCLKDEDIRTVLQMMMDMLGYELSSMSDDLYDHLENPKMVTQLNVDGTAGSLEDLKACYFEHLTEVYRLYVAHSETKNHRAMIGEIKAYIEENFENPDLSLKHLSDRFHISPKYASYLFKEEFNLKFVDFIVKLRMERAQQLLAETNETIQNISTQVGYANSITFGRVFKRVVGVTPGEYRRLKIRPDKTRH